MFEKCPGNYVSHANGERAWRHWERVTSSYKVKRVLQHMCKSWNLTANHDGWRSQTTYIVKPTSTEGKLSAGRHNTTLANMGRGDYVTQEQRIKGSNLTGSRIWIILSPAGPSTSRLLHRECNKCQKPFTGHCSNENQVKHIIGKAETCSIPKCNGSSMTAQAGSPI